MWILPRSITSPFALVPAGSTSEFARLFRLLAASLLWKSKPSPAPSWKRAWKAATWMRVLSGRIVEPSRDESFVDWWTSSLAEPRVKTSPSPGSAQESTGRSPASSGLSSKLSSRSNPNSSSGKTSAGQGLLFPSSSTRSSLGVTPGRPSRFALLTWEQATEESESSCSPTATDAKASGAAGYSTESGRHSGTTLTDAAVRQWPTPTADRAGSNQGGGMGRVGPVRPSLETLASEWRTPSSSECSGGPQAPEKRLAGGHALRLRDQVSTWQTPRASDGDKGGPNQALKGKPALTAQARRWGTPQSRDAKGAPGQGFNAGSLTAEALLVFPSLPAPETPTDGATTPSATASLRLSPDFVEALMGLPVGWTRCGLIDSEPLETGLSLPKPKRRSGSSSTGSEPAHD